MPRYTLCPYFEYERKARISCEDIYRRFDTNDEKWAWMDMYCDSEWMKCPYAIELNEAYERLEKGDVKALENHEIDALKKELKGMATKLGKAEKKLERSQKKVDELTAINKSFIGKNESLEKQKRSYFEKWKESDKKLNDYERKIDDQIKKIVSVYEQRLCYMIENFTDGKVYEDDMAAWAGDKAMALVAEFDDDGIYWQVKYGEEAKEDGPDTNEQSGIQEGQ